MVTPPCGLGEDALGASEQAHRCDDLVFGHRVDDAAGLQHDPVDVDAVRRVAIAIERAMVLGLTGSTRSGVSDLNALLNRGAAEGLGAVSAGTRSPRTSVVHSTSRSPADAARTGSRWRWG